MDSVVLFIVMRIGSGMFGVVSVVVVLICSLIWMLVLVMFCNEMRMLMMIFVVRNRVLLSWVSVVSMYLVIVFCIEFIKVILDSSIMILVVISVVGFWLVIR